jgi:hypothetical protein
MKKIIFTLVLFALGLWSNPVYAKIGNQILPFIDIQFQGASGAAYGGIGIENQDIIVGTSPDIWNHALTSTGTINNVLNTAGNSTNVSFTWEGSGIATDLSGFSATPKKDLMESYLYYTGAGSQNMLFSNLVAGKDYGLFFISQGAQGGLNDATGRQLSVTVNGITQITTPANGAASTYINGQNYLEFSATADINGQIAISYKGANGTQPNINGIQVVPEPSTYALLAIGGMFILFSLRKSYAFSSAAV